LAQRQVNQRIRKGNSLPIRAAIMASFLKFEKRSIAILIDKIFILFYYPSITMVIIDKE
jgi:hypothetical protein